MPGSELNPSKAHCLIDSAQALSKYLPGVLEVPQVRIHPKELFVEQHVPPTNCSMREVLIPMFIPQGEKDPPWSNSIPNSSVGPCLHLMRVMM
eukprot:1010409-Heterocapsa_arctica.AAC.1